MVILVQASQQWNPREIILPIDLPVLLSMRERRIKFLIHRIDKILQVNWLYTKDIRSLSPSSAVCVLAVLAGTPGHAWQIHLGMPGRYTRACLAGTAGHTRQVHLCAPAGRSPPNFLPCLQAWALPPALPTLRTTLPAGMPQFHGGKG